MSSSTVGKAASPPVRLDAVQPAQPRRRVSSAPAARRPAQPGSTSVSASRPADPHGRRSEPAPGDATAMADVLEESADLLTDTSHDTTALRDAVDRLDRQPIAYERQLELEPSAEDVGAEGSAEPGAGPAAPTLLRTIDASFRLQETAHGVSQVGSSALAIGGAEQRTWRERLLGERPEGLPSTAAVARTRLASHLTLDSVWLQNSVRGAVTLGLATFVATEIGLSHTFWVVLGAMAVLRSNALATGQNALRAVLGTTLGFLIGGTIVFAGGTHATALWALLPVAILFAGIAPSAISFTAGQAAFTVMIVVMYNLISPVGWRIGAARVQDVGIGSAVSLIGGLLFWPRGASAMLRRALADAYLATSDHLTSALRFASGQIRPASSPLADGADVETSTLALQSSIRPRRCLPHLPQRARAEAGAAAAR